MFSTSYAIYKFGESRWIQNLLDGKISFSCAGAFIHQAKFKKNTIQGDELEGVFARQLKDNPKVIEMRKQLGNDLEEIPDGEYVFLRRKSAKLKPIFCVYSYTAEDVMKDNKICKVGWKNVRFRFDPRIYEGFACESVRNVMSDEQRFSLALIQPKFFEYAINFAEKKKGKGVFDEEYKKNVQAVCYQNMHEGEFFIEPTEEYSELFIKSEEYAYQHEMRVCLKNQTCATFWSRIELETFKIPEELYIVENCKVETSIEVLFEEANKIKGR